MTSHHLQYRLAHLVVREFHAPKTPKCNGNRSQFSVQWKSVSNSQIYDWNPGLSQHIPSKNPRANFYLLAKTILSNFVKHPQVLTNTLCKFPRSKPPLKVVPEPSLTSYYITHFLKPNHWHHQQTPPYLSGSLCMSFKPSPHQLALAPATFALPSNTRKQSPASQSSPSPRMDFHPKETTVSTPKSAQSLPATLHLKPSTDNNAHPQARLEELRRQYSALGT